MKTLLSSFLIALVLTSLQSVAQDNPLFRHLPPDATSIFQINVPVLVSKLPWQELAQKMATAPKGKSDRMLSMMQNPLATGINITKDFFIAETDKGNPDSPTFVTIIVHLADSAKFVAFLTQQEPGLRFFSYPNKERAAGKGHYGAAWDKDIAVLTIVKAPGEGDHMASSKGAAAQPDAAKKPAHNYAALAAKKSFAALRGFDGSVYTTDATFKEGFSDDADVHAWMQQGGGISKMMKAVMHKNPMGMGGKDMMKAMAMSRPTTHSLIELRFETGKIIVKSLTAYPPDTLAFIQKFGGKSLNTDLIASLPKGNLLAMVNFHFDPAAFGDILDKSHSRAKIDSMMASKGLTTNDIINALKGDLLIAAISPASDPSDSSAGKTQPSVYIALTINDMSSFTKLSNKINLLKDPAAGDSTSADGNPTLMDKAKMGYTLKNNILVISTSKQNANAWFVNTDKRSTDFVPALVKDNPFSLLLDMKTVGAMVKQMSHGQTSEKDKKIFQAFDALDQVILAGGAIKDGRVEGTLEFKMANSSENSLKTLLKLF